MSFLAGVASRLVDIGRGSMTGVPLLPPWTPAELAVVGHRSVDDGVAETKELVLLVGPACSGVFVVYSSMM